MSTLLRRCITALACAATLPSCAASTAGPSPTPSTTSDAYFALGTEPFWSVEITADTIRYNDAENRAVAVRHAGARPSFNGSRYVTPRITVDITMTRCSDGMSDRIYADTVSVTLDGRALSGCGGAILSGPPRP